MIVIGNPAHSKSPLVISSVALVGSNFAVDSASTTCISGAEVQAGSKCHIALSFTPGSTGRLGATLMITDNSTNGPHLVMVYGKSD